MTIRKLFLATVIVLTAAAPLAADAKAKSNVPRGKLDTSLREWLASGCVGLRSVIVTTRPGHREGLQKLLRGRGRGVEGEFPALEATTTTVSCADLAQLASDSSTRAISLNAPVGASSLREDEGLAAKQLQRPLTSTLATRYLGGAPSTSVGVAVIDSGIEPGIDFESRLTASYDFTNGGVRATTPSDAYGHGTHVAGLIGSQYVGVAPYARLIGLKVLDAQGRGTTDAVVRAIEFAIVNRNTLGIQVLNLSLGHPIYESAATDPLVQAVEHATRVGLTVVVAAGNVGTSKVTRAVAYAGIVSPANAPSAITVGAVDTRSTVTRADDRVAPYSSRGPTWYDGFVKPDVVAPGHNLLAAASAGSTLRVAQEARGNTGNYMRLSGTSMAAGVVSGVAALVLQANRHLTPNALKAVLEYTAIPVKTDAGTLADPLTQGAGQIAGAGAVRLARVISTSTPVGSSWLTSSVYPYTTIGYTTYTWSRSILWGQRRLAGTTLLSEHRPAWALDIVWGEGLGEEDDNIVWGNIDDDNIVWGNSFDDGDNIVWGNNIVWGASEDDNIVWGNLLSDDDNIVWGNTFGEDDNIVWGNHIVWGEGLVGLSLDDDNIVWGNQDDDNIVWGNLDDDNIVWGNLFDDNVVWGNSDDDNIVWGNSVGLGSVEGVR